MKRPLDIASLLVFLLPLPFLLRESSLFFAGWTALEFAVSFSVGRLEIRGRLDARARAQTELVLRTICLPLTVLLLEAGGSLTLAALIRYAMTCGLTGVLRLRWLVLFLFLFPAGSILFAFFQSYPEIPFHAAGPVFAAVSLGAVLGGTMLFIRQNSAVLLRARSGMERAVRRRQNSDETLLGMLRLQMDEDDARLFARGGIIASKDLDAIVLSVYLLDHTEPGLSPLGARDFDREWDQFLGRIRETADRHGLRMVLSGSELRFLRSGSLPLDQAEVLSASEEILTFAQKTRSYYAGLKKAWPGAVGFLSRGAVRELSAGGAPQRLLRGPVVTLHDAAASAIEQGPDRSRYLASWPLIDESLPELRAGIEIQSAHVLGTFVLPGKRPNLNPR